MSAGEILYHLRKKGRLTQSAMAQKLGVADWLYYKYEKDLFLIPLELLEKLKGCNDIDAALLNKLQLKVYGESLKMELQNKTEEEKQAVCDALLDRMIQCAKEKISDANTQKRIE